MKEKEDMLGWYYINETWNLFLEGELTKVHVDFINVGERERKNRYLVKHFNRNGELIKTLTLDKEDIDMLENREKTVRPMHI